MLSPRVMSTRKKSEILWAETISLWKWWTRSIGYCMSAEGTWNVLSFNSGLFVTPKACNSMSQLKCSLMKCCFSRLFKKLNSKRKQTIIESDFSLHMQRRDNSDQHFPTCNTEYRRNFFCPFFPANWRPDYLISCTIYMFGSSGIYLGSEC